MPGTDYSSGVCSAYVIYLPYQIDLICISASGGGRLRSYILSSYGSWHRRFFVCSACSFDAPDKLQFWEESRQGCSFVGF